MKAPADRVIACACPGLKGGPALRPVKRYTTMPTKVPTRNKRNGIKRWSPDLTALRRRYTQAAWRLLVAIDGVEVKTTVAAPKEPGKYQVRFNGEVNWSVILSAGVIFVTLVFGIGQNTASSAARDQQIRDVLVEIKDMKLGIAEVKDKVTDVKVSLATQGADIANIKASKR